MHVISTVQTISYDSYVQYSILTTCVIRINHNLLREFIVTLIFLAEWKWYAMLMCFHLIHGFQKAWKGGNIIAVCVKRWLKYLKEFSLKNLVHCYSYLSPTFCVLLVSHFFRDVVNQCQYDKLKKTVCKLFCSNAVDGNAENRTSKIERKWKFKKIEKHSIHITALLQKMMCY